MTKITFIDHQENETEIDAKDGLSLMENARDNDIEGIVAECGGSCACATCHVYIEGDFFEKTGKKSETEEDLLDFNDYLKDNSRLSCQIEVSPALAGMRVHIPEDQY